MNAKSAAVLTFFPPFISTNLSSKDKLRELLMDKMFSNLALGVELQIIDWTCSL